MSGGELKESGGGNGWATFKNNAEKLNTRNIQRKQLVASARDAITSDPSTRIASLIRLVPPAPATDSAIQVVNVVTKSITNNNNDPILLQRDQAALLGISLPAEASEHTFTFSEVVDLVGQTYLNRILAMNSINAEGAQNDEIILQRSTELDNQTHLAGVARAVFSILLSESSHLPATLPVIVQTLSNKQFVAGLITDEAIKTVSREVLKLEPKSPENRMILLSLGNVDVSGLPDYARERLPGLIADAQKLQQKEDRDAEERIRIQQETDEKKELQVKYDEMIDRKKISTKGEQYALKMGDIIAARLIDKDPLKAGNTLTSEAYHPFAALMENPELKKRISKMKTYVAKPQGEDEFYYFGHPLPAYVNQVSEALHVIGALRSIKTNRAWFNRAVNTSLALGKTDMTGLSSGDYAKLDIPKEMQQQHMEEWLRFSIDGTGIALIRRALTIDPPIDVSQRNVIINAALELLFGEDHNLLEPVAGTNPPQTKGDRIVGGDDRVRQWALQTLFNDTQITEAMHQFLIEPEDSNTVSEIQKRTNMHSAYEVNRKDAERELGVIRMQLSASLKECETQYDIVTALEGGTIAIIEPYLEAVRKVRVFAVNPDTVVHFPEKNTPTPSLSSTIDKRKLDDNIIQLKQGIEKAKKEGTPLLRLEKDLMYAQAQLLLEESLSRECATLGTRVVKRWGKEKTVLSRKPFTQKILDYEVDSEQYNLWKNQERFKKKKVEEFQGRLERQRVATKKNGRSDYATNHDQIANLIHSLDFIEDESSIKEPLTTLQRTLATEASIVTNEIQTLSSSTMRNAIELMVKHELFPNLIPVLEKSGVIETAKEVGKW